MPRRSSRKFDASTYEHGACKSIKQLMESPAAAGVNVGTNGEE
jgi:hypothetical protein